ASLYDDCNDADEEILPAASEVCDGKDNNCNSLVDAADTLTGTPTNPGVTYSCQAGGWQITQCPVDQRHCDTNLENGCETDDTALASCRGCDNVCLFACGASDCVEVTQVSAGFFHSCAIDDAGKAACWGKNSESQLGDGGTTQRLEPRLVSLLTGVTGISAGREHSCAIALPSQTVYCWGDDTNEELGNSGAGSSDEPDETSVTLAVDIAAGLSHSCAVRSDGTVYCWGLQANGRLGNICDFLGATCTGTAGPTAVAVGATTSLLDAVEVGVGRLHSCARQSGGTVACWGNNTYGQLGDGTADALSTTARTVSTLSSATALTVGDYHACAVQAGSVYCWGDNVSKQVGQASGSLFNTPQLVPNLTNVIAIGAGSGFTCALTSSQVVSCWGDNTYGQTTASSAAASDTPTAVGLAGVTQLAVGSAHACALAPGSQAWCWGYNSNGQLGNGATNSDSNASPSKVSPLSN
ncbi:MAG: hypothetical protein RJA70_4964, partial [Pseudomonadota bacterium]